MVIKHFLSNIGLLGNRTKLLVREIRGNMNSDLTESKMGGPLRQKIYSFWQEYTPVLAITKPFVSSGCFKKII